jgi:hypothetical protein
MPVSLLLKLEPVMVTVLPAVPETGYNVIAAAARAMVEYHRKDAKRKTSSTKEVTILLNVFNSSSTKIWTFVKGVSELEIYHDYQR